MSMAEHVTQANAASATGEQRSIMVARPSVLAVIPIVIPGFTFPGTEFYDKRLPRLWTENVVTAEALIRSFFKRIAIAFATWASDNVLDTQAQDRVSDFVK